MSTAFAPPARAAEGPDADRPDLAESPQAVPGRAIQLEAGWSREWLETRPDGDRTLDAVGEALVRVGLGSGWEGRMTLPSWFRQAREPTGVAPGATPGARTGLGDAALGVKRELPALGPRIHTGLIAQVSLPVGEQPFGDDAAGPQLTLAASLATAPGDWCANVAYGRTGDTGSALATLAFERPLVPGLDVFAEGAWFRDEGASSCMAGGGLLWSVSERARLDFKVGGSFRGSRAVPLAGVGVARRW